MSDQQRDRDAKGRYTSEKRVDNSDILTAVAEHEPASTREIADAVGVPRRSALRYLDDMAESGAIRKKKLDPRRVVWLRE